MLCFYPKQTHCKTSAFSLGPKQNDPNTMVFSLDPKQNHGNTSAFSSDPKQHHCKTIVFFALIHIHIYIYIYIYIYISEVGGVNPTGKSFRFVRRAVNSSIRQNRRSFFGARVRRKNVTGRHPPSKVCPGVSRGVTNAFGMYRGVPGDFAYEANVFFMISNYA